MWGPQSNFEVLVPFSDPCTTNVVYNTLGLHTRLRSNDRRTMIFISVHAVAGRPKIDHTQVSLVFQWKNKSYTGYLCNIKGGACWSSANNASSPQFSKNPPDYQTCSPASSPFFPSLPSQLLPLRVRQNHLRPDQMLGQIRPSPEASLSASPPASIVATRNSL